VGAGEVTCLLSTLAQNLVLGTYCKLKSEPLVAYLIPRARGAPFLNLGACYPPFLGITKEMMSRGPQVADMEY
jgi:hypothetical protein